MSEVKNRDIVIVGYQSWDITIGSNCKNIAIELAKQHRVLYVNLPIDRKQVLKGKHSEAQKKRLAVIRGEDEGLEPISEGFWSFYPKIMYESINWIGSEVVFDYFNRRNAQRLSKEIQRMITQLQFKDILLFNDSDLFRGVYLKEMLDPVCSIYYIRDYLICQPYFKKHGTRTEKETIRNSDIIVSNSPYLRDYAKPFNQKAYYVGQGCDISRYTPGQRGIPTDMKRIEGVKIGYVGFLTEMRLDIPLLVAIARLRPLWKLVLVGPEDAVFQNSMLHEMENVFFLGQKTMEELPDYIDHFDICINPQLVNDLTIGNYPRKIDEYLGMGKPTVATKTPTMDIFEGVVYLGRTAEEYIALIEKALQEDSPKKQQERTAFAQSHTWENNVKEITTAIEAFLK